MSKKNADVVHEGKRRFWSGTVDTLCGLTLAESCYEKLGWFASVTCPDCRKAMGGWW